MSEQRARPLLPQLLHDKERSSVHSGVSGGCLSVERSASSDILQAAHRKRSRS